MASSKTPKRGLPRHFKNFQEAHPAIAGACEQLGATLVKAGPLDQKTVELTRLAIAVGARQEGGVHSHARRALEAGASADEIRHVVLLSIASIGFPNAMAALSWVEDVLE
jgi:4-carboxymuconolactone decarboxylase